MNLHDGRVVSNFIRQAISGEAITLYGTGEQTRSFCYVDDLIDGLVKLMNTPGDVVGPINLGNPVEFTMKELAAKVIELTSSKSEMVYEALPSDDPQQRKPDTTKASEILGWAAKVDLNAGLLKTIADFKPRVLAL
jgi:UDP-glucuronate decarboxylase